ncbi:MAG: macro domain-containing protein [Sphaerochaeta sp.]|jgi:O-acetyl-ADP-ribose deacetylase (regulator of RNase III)|nr:macro domain-containing protein [Sphaerochaeta sp.]
MPLYTVHDDITTMKTDAIVNAANVGLRMGGGVCGAIFKAAGVEELTRACTPLAPIKTGEAVMTPGFGLKARHIIHTAGPVYQDGKSGEAELLAACYRNSLLLAKEHNLTSISFPLIASGVYGYPKEEALAVATAAIEAFLSEHPMEVYLVLYG